MVELVALVAGFLAGVAPASVPSRLEYMAAHVQQQQPQLLRDIARTEELSDEQRAVLEESFAELATHLSATL